MLVSFQGISDVERPSLILLSDLVDVPRAVTVDINSEVTEAQLYAVRLKQILKC